jgi:hypothetical protein
VTWAGTLATSYYQPAISVAPSLTGDAAATMYTSMPPSMPQGVTTAIMQIVADSYENREASMQLGSNALVVTETAKRCLMGINWGSYV